MYCLRVKILTLVTIEYIVGFIVGMYIEYCLWAQVAVLDIYCIYWTVWDRFMQVMYLGRAPRTKETLPVFLKWCWCGPYPIHGPARLGFKMEGKCEKKMWVDFRVLENPSQRRNGFALVTPLTFIFIFKWGKPSKNKKTPMTLVWKKSGLRKLNFWVRGSDYLSGRYFI